MQTAHLLLGLTRKELKRRVSSGQLDPQILKSQIEQKAMETKLDAISDKLIALKSLDQIDKFIEEE